MKKAGRPKIKFDYEQVEALASMQCTLAEMAAVLKVSEDTITRRLKDDTDFAESIKRGKDKGCASLRRMQYENAKNGNVTMQIWLGKQYLSQSDKNDMNLSGGFKVSIGGADTKTL